ncbi:putative Alpha/beta-Hydrolases superfamily protein [Blattamonas nauphoetae]|uniref:Maspardin n=1 Tax=Blattamonas nauphoetae TaxID=2049346 RepID=A0ABQ9X7H8_9EUKA|nr:putative Alpha/beta-Hydrolases superfamily protein [Blattamonas nauphoetae]
MSFIKNLFKKDPKTKFDNENTDALALFRSSNPEKKVTVGTDKQFVWGLCETYDKKGETVVCLPPLASTGHHFCKLYNALSDKGIRLISLQSPEVDSQEEWIQAFTLLLAHLEIDTLHLLGCGFGGYLALKFATLHSDRIKSLFIVNGFSSTGFVSMNPTAYHFAPASVLRTLIAQMIEKEQRSEKNMASVRFVKKDMEQLTQENLLSQITCYSETQVLSGNSSLDEKLTIIETDDFTSLPENIHNTVNGTFGGGRLILMKTGGDYPAISEADELAMYLTVHMRRFDSALLPQTQESEGTGQQDEDQQPSEAPQDPLQRLSFYLERMRTNVPIQNDYKEGKLPTKRKAFMEALEELDEVLDLLDTVPQDTLKILHELDNTLDKTYIYLSQSIREHNKSLRLQETFRPILDYMKEAIEKVKGKTQ